MLVPKGVLLTGAFGQTSYLAETQPVSLSVLHSISGLVSQHRLRL